MRLWSYRGLLVATCVIFLAALISPAQSAVPGPNQTASLTWTDARKVEMAANVRGQLVHSWQGYRQYAWGHDELRPLSKGFKDWYDASLYMTPVDALDTLVLTGLTEQADQARELIAKDLSFDQDIYVKNFEITIRMLGGLLSSYQLTGDKRLLKTWASVCCPRLTRRPDFRTFT